MVNQLANYLDLDKYNYHVGDPQIQEDQGFSFTKVLDQWGTNLLSGSTKEYKIIINNRDVVVNQVKNQDLKPVGLIRQIVGLRLKWIAALFNPEIYAKYDLVYTQDRYNDQTNTTTLSVITQNNVNEKKQKYRSLVLHE